MQVKHLVVQASAWSHILCTVTCQMWRCHNLTALLHNVLDILAAYHHHSAVEKPQPNVHLGMVYRRTYVSQSLPRIIRQVANPHWHPHWLRLLKAEDGQPRITSIVGLVRKELGSRLMGAKSRSSKGSRSWKSLWCLRTQNLKVFSVFKGWKDSRSHWAPQSVKEKWVWDQACL